MIKFGLVLIAFAAFIGLLMETYKKVVRNDHAALWEIRLVALILSAAFGYVAFEIDTFQVASSPYLILAYTIIIYLLQLPACQKIWKPLIKKMMEKNLYG